MEQEMWLELLIETWNLDSRQMNNFWEPQIQKESNKIFSFIIQIAKRYIGFLDRVANCDCFKCLLSVRIRKALGMAIDWPRQVDMNVRLALVWDPGHNIRFPTASLRPATHSDAPQQTCDEVVGYVDDGTLLQKPHLIFDPLGGAQKAVGIPVPQREHHGPPGLPATLMQVGERLALDHQLAECQERICVAPALPAHVATHQYVAVCRGRKTQTSPKWKSF